MITKITSENKGLYKALFEKASNELGLEGDVTIDSLDKYFSLIGTLFAEDQTYAFLPLDEPTFDINTDTRVITIPSDFRKNGISVKGDHYAETLYFTIDRYFDTTDLYDENIKIIIQWEDPSGQKGVSLAVFKDVSVLASENKMLFGWALTNNITDAHGNVKFSVRFYEVSNSGELTYSLSTLTASAVINPGLDYQFVNGQLANDIPLFAEDARNLGERIRNSTYTDPTNVPAEATWRINLPKTSEAPGVYDKIDLDENNELSFVVEAESTQGVITYTWRWIPTDRVDPTDPIGTYGDVYIITSDVQYNGDKVYYHKTTAGGIDSYTSFNFEPGTLIPKEDDDVAVYEKKSGLTISHHDDSSPDITGEYYVIANNRVGLGVSRVQSNHVIVPGPGDPEITFPQEEITHVFLENGAATLHALATANAGDTITYKFGEIYSEGDDEESLINTVTQTVERNHEVSFDIPLVAEAERNKYDKTYGVEINANRNGRTTNPPELFKYRVTDEPHKPIVVLSQVGTYAQTGSPAYLTATVTNANDIAFDEFIYEWYKYNPNPNNLNSFDIAPSDMVEDTFIGNGRINPAPDHSNTIEVYAGGKYYCKVKTRINGQDSEYWIPNNESDLRSVSELG